jgi:hypothetical protein
LYRTWLLDLLGKKGVDYMHAEAASLAPLWLFPPSSSWSAAALLITSGYADEL